MEFEEEDEPNLENHGFSDNTEWYPLPRSAVVLPFQICFLYQCLEGVRPVTLSNKDFAWSRVVYHVYCLETMNQLNPFGSNHLTTYFTLHSSTCCVVVWFVFFQPKTPPSFFSFVYVPLPPPKKKNYMETNQPKTRTYKPTKPPNRTLWGIRFTHMAILGATSWSWDAAKQGTGSRWSMSFRSRGFV